LLGLIVLVLLVVSVCRGRPPGRRSWWPFGKGLLQIVGIVAGLVVISYLAIWALYGFHYTPAASSDARLDFTHARFVLDRCPDMAALVRWIDQHRLLPNAYSQGFLLKLAEMQGQAAFLAGNYSNTGWWYYFPVAFLIKTPVPLLGLLAA